MTDILPKYKNIKKLLDRTPLRCTLRSGRMHENDDGVGKLREQGFDPEGVPSDGDDGQTYLLIACRQGDVRVVRGLLDLGASATATDEDGYTALMLACSGYEITKRERSEVAEYLLERADMRAIINSVTTSGETALHWAAREGNAAVVHMLLRCGADATKLDKWGRSATAWARKWEKEEVVKRIEDHTALLALDEWRPWNHNEFPHLFRAAARTFVLLAKISSF